MKTAVIAAVANVAAATMLTSLDDSHINNLAQADYYCGGISSNINTAGNYCDAGCSKCIGLDNDKTCEMSKINNCAKYTNICKEHNCIGPNVNRKVRDHKYNLAKFINKDYCVDKKLAKAIPYPYRSHEVSTVGNNNNWGSGCNNGGYWNNGGNRNYCSSPWGGYYGGFGGYGGLAGGSCYGGGLGGFGSCWSPWNYNNWGGACSFPRYGGGSCWGGNGCC